MQAAVGDIRAELNEDDEPGVAVKKGLFALAPLETVVLDTRHIFLDPDDGLDPVLFAKEPGFHWDIWQKEINTSGPGSCSTSEDEEHGLRHERELSVSFIQHHRTGEKYTFHGAMLSIWPMP